LQPKHSKIVKAERALLQSLHNTLSQIGDVPQDTLSLLLDSTNRIDDLFLVCIVGEFNSGKSTLINALLGASLLKSGVLPTTAKLMLLRSSQEQDKEEANKASWRRADNFKLDEVEELYLPQDLRGERNWMRHVAFVDTPGTNALLKEHEALTKQIVPRADLVLFITSALQPMTESETSFLENISHTWGKKVVIVVNKIDALSSKDELESVLDYVKTNAAARLNLHGESVRVLPVSGRLALEAKLIAGRNMDPALSVAAKQFNESRMASLEDYLKITLSASELIHGKLESPLNVADRVIESTIAKLGKKKEMLLSDQRTLEMVQENMNAFRDDIKRDVAYFRTSVQGILNKTIMRANDFFDTKLSIMQPSLLSNSSTFEQEFKNAVLLDLAKPIDDRIKEITALLLQRSKSQASSVVAFVGNRRHMNNVDQVGAIHEPSMQAFDAIRFELSERLTRDIKDILENRNQMDKTTWLNESVRSGFFATLGIEVISVGVAGLAIAHLIDITGLLAASGSAILGLFVFPWKRNAAKKEFQQRVEMLQKHLDETIESAFELELRVIEERISASISPFERFVKSEMSKVVVSNEELVVLRQSARKIKTDLSTSL